MVMKELIIQYPLYSIIIVALVMTLISTLLMKYLTDQVHIKNLKKRQKELQKEIKECQKKKDFCKLEELNKEAIDIGLSMMKASFSIKMMLITLIPFLILFSWLKGIYNAPSPEDVPLLRYWFWWYLGSAIISSTIYRKIFKMA